MRRACSSSWWRRWRGIVWCGLCLLCLALLAIWDTLGYLLTSPYDNRKRHCPPPPVEVDGCASWRPLQLSHPTCNCTRKLLVLHDTCTDFIATDANSYLAYTKEYFGHSHCSDQATLKGPRQHVVSLSIDHVTPKELAALNRTVQQVNSVYKGWQVRIYTPSANHSHPDLCALVCSNPNLDLCDVRGMSKPLDASVQQGRTGWRWAVLGDPLISVWLVRYQDQAILEREAHAVTQFINSDKCWHVMKDHTSHANAALGSGLLGGKTSWGLRRLSRIRRKLTSEVHTVSDEETVLEDTLLPLMGHDVMTHDSITCQKSIESVPFPSQRQPGQWVGMPTPDRQPEMLEPKTGGQSELKKRTVKNSKKPFLSNKTVKSSNVVSAKHDSNPILPAATVNRQEGSHNQEGESKSVHKKQTGSLSHITKAFKREPKVPQKQKNNSYHIDPSKEEEINHANGIVVCPYSCRPHLHPEWKYC
ncbi:uncharacterized protein LOC135205083 [Macrobrachium nipponense]|uniref:uncharacterized protein LOC135205083 n=1 Tax=Macrobrachium nipponense TaxID=159736 RepID=UPI0030C8C779